MAEYVELNTTRYELDNNGYLVNMSQWDSQVMNWFAEHDGIEIFDDHLKVIHNLRDYFEKNDHHPVARVVLKAIAEVLGPEKGTVKYFHELFPGGFNQAFRIAGLPIRHSCC